MRLRILTAVESFGHEYPIKYLFLARNAKLFLKYNKLRSFAAGKSRIPCTQTALIVIP